jgi:hypothetical protein
LQLERTREASTITARVSAWRLQEQRVPPACNARRAASRDLPGVERRFTAVEPELARGPTQRALRDLLRRIGIAVKARQRKTIHPRKVQLEELREQLPLTCS